MSTDTTSRTFADDDGPRWPSGQPTRFAEVNGYRLAYVEAGSGAPLLLVHGSLSDCRAWVQQLDAFAKDYRAFAVSLRHCHPERWDGNGDDFTVEQHAADLAAFIRLQDVGAVHLLGHSRGGAVALSLALRWPRLVRSLTLADPGGLERLLPETNEGRRMAGETERMFARLREDLANGDEEAAARGFVDALGGPGAWGRRSPEQRRMLLDNIRTGPACEQRPRFSRAEIASLNAPILPVTGVRSPSRYAQMLAALRSANHRVADVVVIDGAAHAMNRENPGAFNTAVLGFLAALGPR
jgi:esterase